ncbi:MAG: hypothetical protein KKB46_02400 [Candidatus Omnitrophica bacterium]|nr:hypothetical protein [Candidatus Omnitrophota bacterium]
MQKTFRFFVAFLFALLCVGVYLIAEEITLTTYYPAPFGNYNELQAGKLAVGSSTTMPAVDGNLAAVRIAVGSSATMPTTDGDLVSNGTINAIAYSVGNPATSGAAGVTTINYMRPDMSTGTITVINGIVTVIN